MPNDVEDKKQNLTSDNARKSSPSAPEPQNRLNAQNIQGEPDRTELLTRARSFLASPQVVHQDLSAKRKFLAEKGLGDVEIDALLREVSHSTPIIPPRTYPQSPPSNLPDLFLGLARIFSWIAGGSAVLMFIYWRFLLPRITQTYVARQSLRSHYGTLLRGLTSSLSAFKESQAESYSVLPRPELFREPAQYSDCQTMNEVLKLLDEKQPEYQTIPPITLLRVTVAELVHSNRQSSEPPTTEELFQYMEDKVPWLASEEGRIFEQTIWETLTTCPLFTRNHESPANARVNEISNTARWTYQPSQPPEPTQLQKSLDHLLASLPSAKTQDSKYQHTMQVLSDLTGYISTQVYLPFRTASGFAGFSGNSSQSSPAEEELRREIRALKGLVLNRRSFMTMIPRANSSALQPISR